jgi:hypothetical protein
MVSLRYGVTMMKQRAPLRQMSKHVSPSEDRLHEASFPMSVKGRVGFVKAGASYSHRTCLGRAREFRWDNVAARLQNAAKDARCNLEIPYQHEP